MNHQQFEKSNFGIGATIELSLRVSVGLLVRVLFEHPQDGELMLALERKATILKREVGDGLDVKSQPFGGALQILDLGELRTHIGDFHFDSEESRTEQDFRIFIRPSDWGIVREFCLRCLQQTNNSVLESDPTRELAEEFLDTLQINLRTDQYILRDVGTMVEDDPSVTEYIFARGYPTARIYRIFEARILDSSLASAMLSNVESCSDQFLRELASQDSRNGGFGRANAVLTLPLKELTLYYLTMPPKELNTPIWFQSHQLDETVAAVLDGITVSKYQRL